MLYIIRLYGYYCCFIIIITISICISVYLTIINISLTDPETVMVLLVNIRWTNVKSLHNYYNHATIIIIKILFSVGLTSGGSVGHNLMAAGSNNLVPFNAQHRTLAKTGRAGKKGLCCSKVTTFWLQASYNLVSFNAQDRTLPIVACFNRFTNYHLSHTYTTKVIISYHQHHSFFL